MELSLPSAWYAQDIDRMRQKQKKDSHYLTNSNLKNHVGRLYLNGNNSLFNPWSVPNKPSEELIPLIYIPEYESFRDELNVKLSYYLVSDLIVLFLLCLLFPPLAYWFYRKLHRDKAILFENYIAKSNHFFIKGPRAEALLESVKCGFDDECTVAYIDILYTENTPAPEGMNVGSPSLPILLPLSGTGTQQHPYALDLSDVLVSSIPNGNYNTFIDKEYFAFISQLNRYLRSTNTLTMQTRDELPEIRVCSPLIYCCDFLKNFPPTFPSYFSHIIGKPQGSDEPLPYE